MRIEGAPRYSLSHYYKLPQQSWSWVATLKVLGRFLICQRHLYLPLNFSSCCFAVAVRLSLVALACLPVTFPNLDGLWLDVNYKFFVPPCGFNLKRFATTEIDWLKACASHFSNFSLVSCFPAEPIRNKIVFSDSKVRMTMPYVGVKYACQLPYGAADVSTIRSSVSRCFFRVCWDMLLREV